jgi:hypothetical protein
MRWLGRWLARRETGFLRRLADVPNVPRWSGPVFAGGQLQRHAVAHEYIPGGPLRPTSPVGEEFLDRLAELVRAVHARDIAYVDLHKRENILVGDDGQPYLFDFQISYALPRWWPGNSLLPRIVLRLLQRSDEYHLQKHLCYWQARLAGKGRVPLKRPWWIRSHRIVAVPLRRLRRWLLVQAGVRGRTGRAETELFPEEGVRSEAAA